MNESLIFGKDKTKNVVSIQVVENELHVFTETNGVVDCEIRDNPGQFLLFNRPLSGKMRELKGDNHFKYGIKYQPSKYNAVKNKCYQSRRDFYTVAEPKENLMLTTGITYYKDMKPQDVSVLSFDLETTGFSHNKDSKVLLISNTYRSQGKIERKLFSYEDYENCGQMVKAWCAWVVEKDPSILMGHNIYGFDFPYLKYVCERDGHEMRLGRNNTKIRFDKRDSKKRKDGSQEYSFKNAWIYGREIIDTFFLAITYDTGRNYASYGLKPIIEHEGLQKKDRQFYDASQIGANYHLPDEWVKIKAYAEFDADDALSLFDLMIPSFFSYATSVPKPFQQIINSASGSQLNAFMVRGYLQQGHSLPQKSEVDHFKGATSFGNPGIYKKVYKVDVASLYPSIMRQYKVCNKDKDPLGLFSQTIEYFTVQRLENKRLYKETGERKYKDLSDAQKIFINSAYGFMGAPGLLFNSPDDAAFVTTKGREILDIGLKWCEKKGYPIVNADTDSFSYAAIKGYTSELFDSDIVELNKLFPDLIVWEDDGYYKQVIVVATKNYVLDDGKKVKIKGNSLVATMKSPALKQFIKDVIHLTLKGQQYCVPMLYHKYTLEVNDITSVSDMSRWVDRKTVTETVLKSKDTAPKKIRDAIGKKYVQEGDKIQTFFMPDESMCLLENFTGTYSKDKLHGKLFKTMGVFKNLFSHQLFVDYSKPTHVKALTKFTEVNQCDI